MPGISVRLDGKAPYDENDFANEVAAVGGMASGNVIHSTADWTLATLATGTERGFPSVALGLPLPDGTFLLAETTMKLFVAAARMMVARHGDPATWPD